MSLLQPPPVLMPPPSVFLNQPTKEDVDLVREVRGLFEKRKNEEQEQEQTQARTGTAETPYRLYTPRNHDICIRVCEYISLWCPMSQRYLHKKLKPQCACSVAGEDFTAAAAALRYTCRYRCGRERCAKS